MQLYLHMDRQEVEKRLLWREMIDRVVEIHRIKG
jgi:hypothetical protein